MILKMTDNTQFYISKKQAEQIETLVARGNDHIVLPNSLMIKTKNIMSILPGSDPAHIEAAKILQEGKRNATDEGVRAAREKLQAKLDLIRKDRELKQAKSRHRPAHNIPNKPFPNRKGSIPEWDALYGES